MPTIIEHTEVFNLRSSESEKEFGIGTLSISVNLIDGKPSYVTFSDSVISVDRLDEFTQLLSQAQKVVMEKSK